MQPRSAPSWPRMSSNGSAASISAARAKARGPIGFHLGFKFLNFCNRYAISNNDRSTKSGDAAYFLGSDGLIAPRRMLGLPQSRPFHRAPRAPERHGRRGDQEHVERLA